MMLYHARSDEFMREHYPKTVGLNHAEYRLHPDYPRYRFYETGKVLDMYSPRRNAWVRTENNPVVRLTDAVGRRHGKTTGRMIWEAFNGPLEDGQRVCHRNHDPLDNTLSNLTLEWVSVPGKRRVIREEGTEINRFTEDGLVQHESGLWFMRSDTDDE